MVGGRKFIVRSSRSREKSKKRGRLVIVAVSVTALFIPAAILVWNLSHFDSSFPQGVGGIVTINSEKFPSLDISSSSTYQYTYPGFKSIDSSWDGWATCDPQEAFAKNCNPQPATCTTEMEAGSNKHGIGNAIMVTYMRDAKKVFQQEGTSLCAPKLVDKGTDETTFDKPGFTFRFLDYVQVPNVVVDGTNEKCVAYAITQPKELVSAKRKEVLSELQHQEGTESLPLVALQLRTGWADEMQRNKHGWDKLGSCYDYQDQFRGMNHMAISEIDLKNLLNDVVIAANKAFGAKKWRLYVASDAPGVKAYVSEVMEQYTAGPVSYLKGSVGHNFRGGMANTKEDKIEINVNAFVDMQIMSEADMLVHLHSKFPDVANIRSMCPQRHLKLGGHPRHALARAGIALNDALSARAPRTTPWSPPIAEDKQDEFYELLPGGKDNPCRQDADPLRACYCLIKLSHV